MQQRERIREHENLDRQAQIGFTNVERIDDPESFVFVNVRLQPCCQGWTFYPALRTHSPTFSLNITDRLRMLYVPNLHALKF